MAPRDYQSDGLPLPITERSIEHGKTVDTERSRAAGEVGETSAPGSDMVLRRLLLMLLNNAQLVEKLSETRPIRRAAQITVYAITRLQLGSQEAAERLNRSGALRPGTFARNLGDLSRRAARLKNALMGASGQKKQK
ncbi:protein NCBP2AS2-like [Mobula birostris]|uniref:protein NCBP2AS2-like n=1 Tax=Mobula birostris TaxID=1983395 RepID=UPI003B28A5C8